MKDKLRELAERWKARASLSDGADDADAETLDAIASEIGEEFKHGARAHGLRTIAKRIRSAPAASPAGVPDGYVPVFALPEHFGWADESDRGRFDDAQKFLAGFGLVIAAPSPGESA